MSVYDQIHEICFFGQGGYSWNIVYNMPIWLREYTAHKIKTYLKPEESTEEQFNESAEKYKKELINKPNIPTYKAKAPKK